MAPTKKRENQYFDVGVQGRKTGITLQDRGVRDEHGMEPISGIFSSPEKSPPKRGPARETGGTVTSSESMDLQESSIPDLADQAGHFVRNPRTRLPPPARSPMKTALGSSPRRQSSMGPGKQLSHAMQSPGRASSHPVTRRLDFDQEESSLQETPVLTGSGTRRAKARSSVYSLEPSPPPGTSALLDESLVQEEITANEDSLVVHSIQEDTYIAPLEDDVDGDANGADETAEVEESEIAEPVKQPATRGRKRKSDAVDSPVAESTPPKVRRKGAPRVQAVATQKSLKKAQNKPTITAGGRGRPKRGSNVTEDESSIEMNDALDDSVEVEHTPTVTVPKPRGRPPKGKGQMAAPKPKMPKSKGTEKPKETTMEKETPVFKKPRLMEKSAAGPKARSGPGAKKSPPADAGKLIDIHRKEISKDEIDKMSTASTGSRYGRGRQLASVYREIGPDEGEGRGEITRTRRGRHHLKPVNFWANEQAVYKADGTLESIITSEYTEPPTKQHKSYRGKAKKRSAAAIEEEEEEEELEDWEISPGTIIGDHHGFEPETEVTTEELQTSVLAWNGPGITSTQVQGFQFAKVGTMTWFNWGTIELPVDGTKRPKNCRRMHMVFFVVKGTVEATVGDNNFTIHKGGIFQVPRGNYYSMTNVGKGEVRVFFAQAQEQVIQVAADETEE